MFGTSCCVLGISVSFYFPSRESGTWGEWMLLRELANLIKQTLAWQFTVNVRWTFTHRVRTPEHGLNVACKPTLGQP